MSHQQAKDTVIYMDNHATTPVDPRVEITGAGAGPIVVIGTTGARAPGSADHHRPPALWPKQSDPPGI